MTDAQILAAGSAAAPLEYTVPNAQEILLKAVNADFDGTGAGGAYLPAVEIVSDGGVILARAIGTSVAAGASASVSFFPRVGAAATTVTPVTGSGVAWAYTKSNPAGTSIGSGLGPVYFSVQDTGGVDRFETSDATVFANASTLAFTGLPVWGIQINAPGTYMVQGAAFWIAQGTTGRGISHYYTASAGSAPSHFQFGRTDSLTGDNWSHAGAAPGLPHMSYYEFISVSAGQVGAVLANYAVVQSGGASTVTSDMMIFQLGSYVAQEL